MEYSYEEVKPIYDKYSKYTPEKLVSANFDIDVAIEELNHIDELEKKENKTIEEIEKLKKLKEEYANVNPRILKLKKYVITEYIEKNKEPQPEEELPEEEDENEEFWRLYDDYASKDDQTLINLLSGIKRDEKELKILNTKIEHNLQIFNRQTKGWVNRKEHNELLTNRNVLEQKANSEKLLSNVINRILDDRGNEPFEEPEVIMKQEETEIAHSVDLSHEEDRVLQNYYNEITSKIKQFEADITRMRLLEEIPDTIKSEPVKVEIDNLTQKGDLEYMDIESVYKDYNLIHDELLKRGLVKNVMDSQTQTDPKRLLIDQAKDLIMKFPNLKESIMKVMVSDFMKEGNVKKSDIESINNIYKVTGQPTIFQLPISEKN